MADWKQITARIRRAKGSKDPTGQLSNLFQKTRDAMVAFELARHMETAGQSSDAAKWYAISWQRFRRGDWKTKAQDAVARLGGALPAEGEVLAIPEVPQEAPQEVPQTGRPEAAAATENSESVQPVADTQELAASSTVTPPSASTSNAAKSSRRRGRRGGRNRRKPGSTAAQPSQTKTAPSAPVAPPLTEPEIIPPRVVDTRSLPRVPVETAADIGGSPKGRFGDPGLSSRLSLLEMQFRRLLTCSPSKLDQADRAPAGPGVFVLTDDDLTTYYYVEACDTLRIAIANMARGGANRRTGVNIKPLLADHLGIPEARVSKYLADHCVVRWLQLDEGAEHFAHFTIAVLRPILNTQS